MFAVFVSATRSGKRAELQAPLRWSGPCYQACGTFSGLHFVAAIAAHHHSAAHHSAAQASAAQNSNEVAAKQALTNATAAANNAEHQSGNSPFDAILAALGLSGDDSTSSAVPTANPQTPANTGAPPPSGASVLTARSQEALANASIKSLKVLTPAQAAQLAATAQAAQATQAAPAIPPASGSSSAWFPGFGTNAASTTAQNTAQTTRKVAGRRAAATIAAAECRRVAIARRSRRAGECGDGRRQWYSRTTDRRQRSRKRCRRNGTFRRAHHSGQEPKRRSNRRFQAAGFRQSAPRRRRQEQPRRRRRCSPNMPAPEAADAKEERR